MSPPAVRANIATVDLRSTGSFCIWANTILNVTIGSRAILRIGWAVLLRLVRLLDAGRQWMPTCRGAWGLW